MRRVTGSLETGTQRDLFRGFGLPRKSQRQSLKCSRIACAIAMRSSSFSSLRKPGIVTLLSAKAMSNVRRSSRVQTTKEASFS
jgi:hypothetical protein